MPSFLYSQYKDKNADWLGITRVWTSKFTFSYKYDGQGRGIIDGPGSIKGEYFNTNGSISYPSTYNASVNITFNYKNEMKDGVYSGTYTEKLSAGRYGVASFSSKVNTTFEDDKVKGGFNYNWNAVIDGEKSSGYYNFTVDSDGKVNKYNCLINGSKIDISVAADGSVSGVADNLTLKSNVITNYFKQINGESCPVGKEQSDIITKYLSGEYTKQYLVGLGYILDKGDRLAFDMNSVYIGTVSLDEKTMKEYFKFSTETFMLRKINTSAVFDPFLPFRYEYDEENCCIIYTSFSSYNAKYYTTKENAEKVIREYEERFFDSAKQKVAKYWSTFPDRKHVYYHWTPYLIKTPELVLTDYEIIDVSRSSRPGANFKVSSQICYKVKDGCEVAICDLFFNEDIDNLVGEELNIIHSDWDVYREKKAQVLSQNGDIHGKRGLCNELSFSNYESYFSGLDLTAKATADESIRAMSTVLAVQNSFAVFIDTYNIFHGNYIELLNSLSSSKKIRQIYFSYVDALSLVWEEKYESAVLMSLINDQNEIFRQLESGMLVEKEKTIKKNKISDYVQMMELIRGVE